MRIDPFVSQDKERWKRKLLWGEYAAAAGVADQAAFAEGYGSRSAGGRILEAQPMEVNEKWFYIPSVETRLIESKHVDQTYQIQVMQPLMRRGEKERFAALYISDGNASFDVAKGISHCLQIAGCVRRFILIGIGYPGDNPCAGNLLRWRDMTSDRRPEIACLRSRIEGVEAIESGKKNWGGASDFLAFIRNELMVLIDKEYPTIPDDCAYFGHSLGGGLGLHALFRHTGLFNRYVLSSPSISFDGDDHAIQQAREFIASGKRLDARVVMTVGEREEFDEDASPRSQFVSSFFRFAALLHKARIPGLNFSSRIYPGETHSSIWPIAFSHGVQAIYGPAESPPMAART